MTVELTEARSARWPSSRRSPTTTSSASPDPILSPLVWDLAHIAAYEDLWLCHRHGGLPLLRPELAEMYDAFETPRGARGELPLLDRAEALEYLAEVRGARRWRSSSAGPGRRRPLRARPAPRAPALRDDAAGDRAGRLRDRARRPASTRARARRRRANGPRARRRPRRARARSAPTADGFAYDNERPRHQTDVRGFRIGRIPITNATYLHFVEGGGYERREWWTDEAWHWKEEYDITHPEGWAGARTASGAAPCRRRPPLDPHEPVVHVSWFEADAFARAHGARLPTEVEWEKAATWDQATGETRRFPWGDDPRAARDGRANLDHALLGPAPAGVLTGGAAPCGALGMLGDVWEWTASEFTRLRRASAPTRTASTPRSSSTSDYYVLRGGSWASRAHAVTPTFRNWDLPQRRQIFCGSEARMERVSDTWPTTSWTA